MRIVVRIMAGVIVAGLCLAGPGAMLAQDVVKPGPEDFSFRRVKVPQAGAGRRITVQIDPVEQARRLAVAPKPITALDPSRVPEPGGALPSASTPATYGWFWDRVPTARDASRGSFALAMAQLGRGPDGSSVRAPRLQQMQEIARAHGIEILKATIGTEVSPALVLAVIGVESAGRADAVSMAGAVGLMQLIPATAARFGVRDATDAGQNIRGGVAYLDWLMKEFDRDPLMVLAAYNAGEGAVRANAGVPPYSETRNYVPLVLAAWQVAQGLCQSPPELVSDPCVFKVIASGG